MAIDFRNSPFGTVAKPITIPSSTKVIFVADLFAEDYVGGAELTSESLITSSPHELFKLKCSQLTEKLLTENLEKFWVFGNFTSLDPQLIPLIVTQLKYSVVEYDYKYCKFRSPEKHKEQQGVVCDCHNTPTGKLVADFLQSACVTWWMSEKQKQKHTTLFPTLESPHSLVLSSVFDKVTLAYISKIREANLITPKKGWIVLGSNSWIKGTEQAIKWCIDNNKEYEVVSNLPYNELLDKLATAEGLVYLPLGGDTCPRLVIEAKLLGRKLHINENVQHAKEEWFATDNIPEIEGYLYATPKLFWDTLSEHIESASKQPTISGYVTTYNCVKQQYPIRKCIESMLQFCDEVCVVDGGSTDDTLNVLAGLVYKGIDVQTCEDMYVWVQLSKASGESEVLFPDEFRGFKRDSRFNVKVVFRDWSSKREAIFDGEQKAVARNMCTKEFCWQMDSDEVVHPDDAKKIPILCRALRNQPQGALVIALPVVEYWGGTDKVRIDITPWKWRLSKNHPDLTHGIPSDLRYTDTNGLVWASTGTDGCDMITKSTGERVPFVSFYNEQVDAARKAALSGNTQALLAYEGWYNQIIENVPCVYHFSWYDLPRKIRLYRDFWTKHWCQITGKDYVDSAETNMMFDVPWSQVTEEMIEHRAKELKDMGGWIWHRKWDGYKTPWIKVNRNLEL
jgi:glycosyltransferase involved in cell wall biosynthesis